MRNLGLFVPCAPLLAVLTFQLLRPLFLALPLQSPGLWALAMLLYALLAAYPQELIYSGTIR